MKITFGILSFCILAFLFTCCKKNDIGGDASLLVHTAHHNGNITGATVYVKCGVYELPANITSNYDLKYTAAPDEDHIHITGLRCGNYYLYAVGYDSTISQPVSGGIPVEIPWKERKSEIEIHIPTTE